MKNDTLNDWVEVDIAIIAVGQELGIFPAGKFIEVDHSKTVTWTDNPIGNSIYRILKELVNLGYISYDEAEEKYKINDKFNYTMYLESDKNEK